MFKKFLLLLTVLGLLTVAGCTSPDNAAPPPPQKPIAQDHRPNVIVMLVDDMRKDDMRYLPKTRKLLGARGVTFSNAISVNPLCCPARASLITAQYTHNNGVLANKGFYGSVDALKRPDETLPVWLQEAGYSTAYFGKYMNGYNDAEKEPVPAGWDWWDATGKGTYAYTKFQFANNGNPEYFTQDYITTRLQQRAEQKIEEFSTVRAEEGKPFFIFDSFIAPHGSIGASPWVRKRYGDKRAVPEAKYRNIYLDEKMPSATNPSFNKFIKNYPVTGKVRSMKLRSKENLQNNFISRIQSLASVDDAVENTVAKLKQTGQYGNTVIMFMSDNGFILGENAKYGKMAALDHSLRVPLIIAGPGFAKGEVSSRWASTPDLAATVVRLAQAEPTRIIDGVSLKGAGAQDVRPRAGLLVENGNDVATSAQDAPFYYQGLLMGYKYTYTSWASAGKGEELYDNVRDPYQMVNVAEDARYRKVLTAARKELAKIKDCNGVGTCVTVRKKWPEPTENPWATGRFR